jgi:pimeloyl-ACP methyl ester carboxylesterase
MITTHVLDTARGKPAAGILVQLDVADAATPGGWRLVSDGKTDADGRCRTLVAAGTTVAPGVYRLRFETGAYLGEGFYPTWSSCSRCATRPTTTCRCSSARTGTRPTGAASGSHRMTPSRSGHLAIHGLQLYHEVHGELGQPGTVPLLLMSGSFMATDTMRPWVEAFAARRAVILFDPQGHGRTPDTSREMSYEQFGDDAAALLRALKVERADVMGYSQGGCVALQLALRHPALVSKLVVMSATYRQDGWHPASREAMRTMNATAFAGTPVATAFAEHTPDPQAFEAYVEKMKVLAVSDHDITDAQLRAMVAPTMVMVGDADAVRLEHAVAMFKLRGGGDEEAAVTGTLTRVPAARLVILPATSHIAISGEVKVLEPMVTAFLDGAAPANPSLWP